MEPEVTNPNITDSLLNEAPCGFIAFDDKGVITLVNRTIASMLLSRQEEMIGHKLEQLLTVAGKIFYQTHLFPLLKIQEKAEEIFLTLIAHDRSEVPVLVNVKRVKRGELWENHCVVMSVPQRKKYESELLEARRSLEQSLHRNEVLITATEQLEQHKVELDKQISRLSNLNEDLIEFSKVISHDIQEPIRKIAMFADIVYREDHTKLSDVSKVSLDKIKLATRRVRDLISSLQQYVSVDTNNAPLSVCDLDDILSRARLKVMIDSKFQAIEIMAEGLPKVDGHCEQLEMMFYHLIQNAVQFRKDSEKATIRVEADVLKQNSFQRTAGKYRYVDFVRLRFSDSGIGFDNQYRDYIFGLFKKAHSEATGLGFGLALCKKIAENHGGSITALSREYGATFTILLPISSGLVLQSEELGH